MGVGLTSQGVNGQYYATDIVNNNNAPSGRLYPAKSDATKA